MFPEVEMGDWTSKLIDIQDRHFKGLALYLKKTFISGFYQLI
jgi:hypothetical protein